MSALTERNFLYRRPDVYDALAEGDRSKADQVLRLASAYGCHPATSLLDLGCGTGRDLDLCTAFKRRLGVDSQPGMIRHGREQRPHLDLRIGDLRSVRLGERFDVLTCLGNTFGYLHSDDDQHAAWRTFTAHAHHRTLLILQTLLAPVSPAAGRQSCVTIGNVEVVTEWETRWDAASQISTMIRTWHLDDAAETDLIERRVTSQGELSNLADAHGWAAFGVELPDGYFIAQRQ